MAKISCASNYTRTLMTDPSSDVEARVSTWKETMDEILFFLHQWLTVCPPGMSTVNLIQQRETLLPQLLASEGGVRVRRIFNTKRCSARMCSALRLELPDHLPSALVSLCIAFVEEDHACKPVFERHRHTGVEQTKS